MANVINYAERWQQNILDIFFQQTLSSPFLTSNVEWLNAKTFHFTQMTVGGYQPHALTGGWNRQDLTQTDVPFTLTHDRDVEFLIDKREMDESNATASIQNVTQVFTETQSAPEIDAYFFSKVATTALALGASNSSSTAIAGYTVDTVYGLLKDWLAKSKLRRYRSQGSLLMYVTSYVMNLLEQSTDFTRQIQMLAVGPNDTGLQSRITEMDGVPIIEVIDSERFWTVMDFSDGYQPAVGAFHINVLIASVATTKTVPKISSIYNFAPGQHSQGDGWLYQNRFFMDTFVFPNGKDGIVDSIYADIGVVPVPSP